MTNSNFEFINTYTRSVIENTKKYDAAKLCEYNTVTLQKICELNVETRNMIDMLKSNIAILESNITSGEDFINLYILPFINAKKDDDYVYNANKGMLKYNNPIADIYKSALMKNNTDITKTTSSAAASASTAVSIPPIPAVRQVIDTRQNIIVTRANVRSKISVVSDLKNIQPIFHYLKNSGTNTSNNGIYCCIANGVYAKVDLDNIYDVTNEYDRSRTIRCKHKTRANCDAYRSRFAKQANGDVRICNFAHSGEKLCKIGFLSKCVTHNNYGTPEYFHEHSKNITIEDIKNILYYALPEVLAAFLWLGNNNNKEIIWNDLSIIEG